MATKSASNSTPTVIAQICNVNINKMLQGYTITIEQNYDEILAVIMRVDIYNKHPYFYIMCQFYEI